MKVLDEFLREKGIIFKSEKSKMNWIRKLQPETLVKIGITYFVQEQEMDKLIAEHLEQQIKNRKSRIKKQQKKFKQQMEEEIAG